MKIKLYWPNCDFLGNVRVDKKKDAYWVECTYEEAEREVFPYLTPEQIEKSKRLWEPREKDSIDIQFETDRLCYLVSKDIKVIMPYKWYYPYAGQWNAYCPFVRIKEIEINKLEEINRIIVDPEVE